MTFQLDHVQYRFTLDHYPAKPMKAGSLGREEMWDLSCHYGPYSCCVPITSNGDTEEQALRIVDRFAEAGHLVSGLTVKIKEHLPEILEKINPPKKQAPPAIPQDKKGK